MQILNAEETTGRKLQHVMTEMFLCETFVEKNDVTITWEPSSLAPRLQLDLDLMESGILPQFGPWMIYSPFKETDRVNFRGTDSANLKASKSILAALKW